MSILQETDILCLPSYKKLPKALIEGAAMGLPIVTTDTVDAEMLLRMSYGFLVPVKNIEELSQKIYKLIMNKKLREKMGKESFKIASKVFFKNNKCPNLRSL